MSKTNRQPLTPEYEEKYADFLRLCREAKPKGIKLVAVAYPGALGETYDEVITSLGLLADHDLMLRVVASKLS